MELRLHLLAWLFHKLTSLKHITVKLLIGLEETHQEKNGLDLHIQEIVVKGKMHSGEKGFKSSELLCFCLKL